MGKPKQVRQQEIIEALLELAAKTGLAKVSTQHIADAVGIAQPTIFRHFKTREDIICAAVDHVTTGLSGRLSPLFKATTGADKRLESIITEHLRFLSEQPGFCRLLLSDQTHLESPSVREKIQTAMESYALRLSQLIDEGIRSGVFVKKIDSTESAKYLVALFQGLLLRWSLFDFEFSLANEGGKLWQFYRTTLIN